MEKKATGCHRLVCMSFWDKTAPVVKSLVLVDNLKRSLSFGILRTGAMVKAFFSISKAFCCSIPKVQVYSDLVWDDLTALLVWVNKENLMEFLFNSVHYLYIYYMVCALLSHAHHVMSPDFVTHYLWHVIWYFPALLLV